MNDETFVCHQLDGGKEWAVFRIAVDGTKEKLRSFASYQLARKALKALRGTGELPA